MIECLHDAMFIDNDDTIRGGVDDGPVARFIGEPPIQPRRNEGKREEKITIPLMATANWSWWMPWPCMPLVGMKVVDAMPV